MLVLTAVIARRFNTPEGELLWQIIHQSNQPEAALRRLNEFETKLAGSTAEGKNLRETYCEVTLIRSSSVLREYMFKDPVELARKQAHDEIRAAREKLQAKEAMRRALAAPVRALEAVTSETEEAQRELGALQEKHAALLGSEVSNLANAPLAVVFDEAKKILLSDDAVLPASTLAKPTASAVAQNNPVSPTLGIAAALPALKKS